LKLNHTRAAPLIRGTLVRRYKRFLADVRLEDGRVVTAHCPNSGSMRSCCEPGRPVLLSAATHDRRKLRYTWEMIRMGRTWVGVHSVQGNALAETFIRQGRIDGLAGYSCVRREVTPPACASRLDLRLDAEGAPSCWIEIKWSTLRVGWDAAFPDAVTSRGRRHLEALAQRVAAGERAMMLFFVGRNDCRRLRPADEIDPDYGATLRRVVDQGVEAMAYRLRLSPGGIALGPRLPLVL